MLRNLTLLLLCRATDALGNLPTTCKGAEMDSSTLLQVKVDIDGDMGLAAKGRNERAVGDAESSSTSGNGIGYGGHGNSNASVRHHPYDFSSLNVQLPDDYTGKTPLPLLIMLHGYGNDQASYETDYGMQGRINTDKFIQMTPPGRMDRDGNRYWQAWGSQCGYCGDSDVNPYPCAKICGDDDVSYFRSVIYAATRNFNVDTKRIYINGHSDGAAMAYRLACDASDLITAVMVLAGSPPEDNWKPGYACRPSQPVSVLHIHGTEDDDVFYKGSSVDPNKGADGKHKNYKGAAGSVDFFAALNACPKHGADWFPASAAHLTKAGMPKTLRLGEDSSANDTEVFRATGCKGGSDVELWKVHGVRHNPSFRRKSYQKNSLSWLLGHSKAAAPSISVPSCVDKLIAWEDSGLDRCQVYARKKFCTNTGKYGVGWKKKQTWLKKRFEDFATGGVSATQACCACGGGLKTA